MLRPSSLDAPVQDGTASLADLLAVEDEEREALEARLLLGPVVRALRPRDREILVMRFFEDRTQAEIAAVVGVTQSQVSRTLSRILDGCRPR